jgi:carbon storage regulator
MLVLSRKLGEEIVINENITITVMRISRDSVRIGITAPPTVPVHRQEVWEAIRGVRAVESGGEAGTA